MKIHTDFFRGGLCAAFGIEPLGSIKLAEWADSPDASLTAPITAGYPQSLQSLQSLRPLFSFEAARFASAAFESYSTVRSRWIDPEDRDGLAWQFVSLYYSAYYAAHAILRLSGLTVTQIESWRSIEAEFKTLYTSATLPALGLVRGYHVLKLDATGTSISILKAQVDSSNGSHTALWREFKHLADQAYANNSLNTSLHQAACAAYIQKVSRAITIDGTHCVWPWMPVIRNRINYRLPDEIWGPPARRITPSANKRIHTLLNSPSSTTILDAAGDSSVWLRFSGGCLYVLSLLGHLIQDMELRATSKSFLPALCKQRAPIISRLCTQ